MHDCVVKLIRSNDEESFECLCKLLVTIGKDLDHEKAKVSLCDCMVVSPSQFQFKSEACCSLLLLFYGNLGK